MGDPMPKCCTLLSCMNAWPMLQKRAPCPKYTSKNTRLQILAETIEDLVDGAPGSLAFDGSVLLGAKDTTLYVLDSRSGQLLEEVTAIGGRLLQVAAILGETSERSCTAC